MNALDSPPPAPNLGPHRGVALRRTALALLGATALAWVLFRLPAHSDEPVRVVPAPVLDEPAAGAGANAGAATASTPGAVETAVLAGGCFWGVQGVFEHVKGVRRAVSGYAGGAADTANYETVSTGRTGHAESVEITYDPAQISYGRLLQIYFSVVHDPTELNFQGPDHGTQYRSAIFVKDDTQRKVAEAYIAQLGKAGVYSKPIVTRVEPLTGFYPAEKYHQDYLTLNPDQPYIAYNDIPKVRNLSRLFADRYRDTPVLTTTTMAAR
jgi:peptide-methionine (S)-S-oxide reductase